MRFSLVLATLGRTHELDRFLSSLVAHSEHDIELIVVDQNDDDRLVPLLAPYANLLTLKHVRSSPGLSRARNVGLPHCSGDVVAFPDDDCWYSAPVLAAVSAIFSANPACDGITGRSIQEDGLPSGGRFATKAGAVQLHDVWAKGISYTIFLRRHVCEAVGAFDEQLGVGARTRFGSGEETDYLIRALKLGFVLLYEPRIVVSHPDKLKVLNDDDFVKARRYGAGMGRVMYKHQYPLSRRIRAIARPAIGSLLSLLQLKPQLGRYRWQSAVGRLEGMVLAREEYVA